MTAHAEQPVTVSVLGTKLTGTPAAMETKAGVCGPLVAIAKLAGANTIWDARSGKLTISRIDIGKILLQNGSNEMQTPRRTVPLSASVSLREGQAWGPVSPLLEVLGCRVNWKTGDDTLKAVGILKRLEIRVNTAGAQLFITTSAPVKGLMGKIDDPPKRYVDLTGIEATSTQMRTRNIFTGLLIQVRLGQPDGKSCLRVVGDLTQKAEAHWQAASDGCGGILQLGDTRGKMELAQERLPKLTGIHTQQPSRGLEKLRIATDFPVTATWDLAIKPPRITLKLQGVASDLRETDLPMFGEFVDTVKVNTTKAPASTELIVFLRELVRFDVSETPGGGIEILFRRGRLQDEVIAIDPGHGGKDNGASGLVLKEKDVNLDVATRTVQHLNAAGGRAFLTRPNDKFVDLYDRPRIAQQGGASLFVSVHCNAMPKRNEGRGTETFYYTQESKCLGYLIQNSLIRWLGRIDRGLKQARFVVIREQSIPAVLVELMFLNDDQEEMLLQQNDTREAAAVAITEGLRQYIEGSGVPDINGRLAAN